ncbi:YjhX family toxin [Polycladidibacter stylochi]|uniref:YjhX family toxin n=1 Tax=Polycladidibacter stylochi TaxID=1807766 RepID=UPI000833F594|nr:YjhX family toxin [Pseudovibrio stylochi]
MNISKDEQRILHVLAQGGCIKIEKCDQGKIIELDTITRDGWYMSGLTLPLFRKLKRRRLIASKNSGPYKVTKLGLKRVRSQVDNR